MKENYVNILNFVSEGHDLSVNIHASDLLHFGRQLIAQARAEYERERASINQTTLEPLFTANEVKAALKISDITLYRYAVKGYLVPILVGGEKRYRKTDLDKIYKN